MATSSRRIPGNKGTVMSDMLFISQISEYLYMKYGVRRVRRTISYWTKFGLLVKGKHVRLKTARTRDNQLYTRKAWVDRFIEKVSRRDRK